MKKQNYYLSLGLSVAIVPATMMTVSCNFSKSEPTVPEDQNPVEILKDIYNRCYKQNQNKISEKFASYYLANSSNVSELFLVEEKTKSDIEAKYFGGKTVEVLFDSGSSTVNADDTKGVLKGIKVKLIIANEPNSPTFEQSIDINGFIKMKDYEIQNPSSIVFDKNYAGFSTIVQQFKKLNIDAWPSYVDIPNIQVVKAKANIGLLASEIKIYNSSNSIPKLEPRLGIQYNLFNKNLSKSIDQSTDMFNNMLPIKEIYFSLGSGSNKNDAFVQRNGDKLTFWLEGNYRLITGTKNNVYKEHLISGKATVTFTKQDYDSVPNK